MKKLSAVILTSNEEEDIADCIKTLSFADEIIVVDDCSTDATVTIAKKIGARIYTRKLDDFASQRNYGLSVATGDWVLFIDADERVSKNLRNEIVFSV